MKKIAISAALILAPVLAQASDLPSKTSAPKLTPKQTASFDGYIGGDIGYQTTDHSFTVPSLFSNSAEVSGMTYGAHGAFSTMLSGPYGLQIDADLRRTEHDFSDAGCVGSYCTIKSMSPSLAAHLFWRDSSKGLIGAFVQYTSASKLIENFAGTEHTYIGLEGQYFMNNMTIYGQIAYVSAGITSESLPADADGYIIAGQLRYFADPNLMLALKASYTATSWSAYGYDLSDNTTSSIGARIEYRLTNAPISVYGDATYNVSDISYKDAPPFGEFDYGMDETRFLIGVNFNFGGASLLERDRSGASLNIIEAPHSPIGIVGGPT